MHTVLLILLQHICLDSASQQFSLDQFLRYFSKMRHDIFYGISPILQDIHGLNIAARNFFTNKSNENVQRMISISDFRLREIQNVCYFFVLFAIFFRMFTVLYSWITLERRLDIFSVSFAIETMSSH